MEIMNRMKRLLAVLMCLVLVSGTCAFAKPVVQDEHAHQYGSEAVEATEEVVSVNVDEVVEELDSIDLSILLYQID